jgi:hypothetical protein
MSCDYKFKTRMRIRSGNATAVTEEKFTFTRAAVELHLVKLQRKGELNQGEQALKKIFSEALQKPWAKLTITKKQ